MDYKKAASYWIEKDEKAIRMDSDALMTWIEKFIMVHNTCPWPQAAVISSAARP